MDKADAYAPGQGYLNGEKADFDLCFQIHSKIEVRPGRQPQEDVRAARSRQAGARRGEGGGWQRGLRDRHSQDRGLLRGAHRSRFAIIRPEDVVKPRPERVHRTGRRADERRPGATWTWRASGRRRYSVGAYLATGDDKYAKKLNDLMIEWMVGWPLPGQTNIGGTGWDGMHASLSVGPAHRARVRRLFLSARLARVHDRLPAGLHHRPRRPLQHAREVRRRRRRELVVHAELLDADLRDELPGVQGVARSGRRRRSSG